MARCQRTNQAFADIDVQLKQRHDLVPGLVQVVKVYATHEKELLEAVIRARSLAMAASPICSRAVRRSRSGFAC